MREIKVNMNFGGCPIRAVVPEFIRTQRCNLKSILKEYNLMKDAALEALAEEMISSGEKHEAAYWAYKFGLSKEEVYTAFNRGRSTSFQHKLSSQNYIIKRDEVSVKSKWVRVDSDEDMNGEPKILIEKKTVYWVEKRLDKSGTT